MTNFNLFLNILADASPAPQGGFPTQLILILGMMIVFYFFMIRPQSKKAKKQKEFITKLEKGQKVVTLAGIHGKIFKVNEDNTLDIEISAGSFLKIEKSSISMELSAAVNKDTVNLSADKK